MTESTLEQTNTTFDVDSIRQDFPILEQQVHGHPLVYLDNAATAQTPKMVINAISNYYQHDNSNVHRGVHQLSERATSGYEGAREKARQFMNASSTKEIIFTRGTTDAINLVAQTYGRTQLQTNDEILISTMEHHSNIVPWQLLCEQTGAKLIVIPINQQGELDLEDFQKLLTDRTKLLSLVHVSNALGTVNPIKMLIELAHQNNTPVLIDGAQAAPHLAIDVQALNCDFYAFSGHKCYGPTGIGVLYAKEQLLETMPPYQGGGEMIARVSFESTTYNDLPYKFEAGTPNIAGAIGLGAAIDYVTQIGLPAIACHEHQLLHYAENALSKIPNLNFVGTAQDKAAVVSFTFGDIHAHDIGTVLDHEGIAIRSGHHCAMPVMAHFGIPASARASFAMYNTFQEIDALVAGLERVREVFA